MTGATLSPRPLRRVLAYAPLGLLVLFAVLFQQGAIINHDTAWYLDATARLLDGAELYRDIVEVNPPLAFWLTLPPVAFAELLGLPAVPVYQGYFFLLAGLSLLACRRLLRLQPAISDGLAVGLVTGLAVAMLAAPLRDFGQREHLLVILLAPYLLLAGLRADGIAVPARWAALLGGLAALGIALKPHFLPVPLAIELWLLWRQRSLLAWLRPEALGALAAAALYLAAVALFAPAYVTTVMPLAMEVYDLAYNATWQLVASRGQRLFLALILVVGLLFALRRALPSGIATALGLGAAGCFAAYLLQFKGWTYHSYPTLALLATVAVTAASALVLVRLQAAQRWLSGLSLCLLVGLLALDAGLERLRFVYGDQAEAGAIVEGRPEARSLYVFSSNVWATYPWVLESHVESVSRYPCHWLLPGFLLARAAGRDSPRLREIEAYMRESVLEDFTRHSPDLVFVDARPRKSHFEEIPFDYLAFFSSDPRFAALWRGYSRIGRTEDYLVFARETKTAHR